MNSKQERALMVLSKVASRKAAMIRKQAGWQDAARYAAMYGLPTLAGAGIGAYVDKKDRLRGGLLGGLLGLGTGGLIHAGTKAFGKKPKATAPAKPEDDFWIPKEYDTPENRALARQINAEEAARKNPYDNIDDTQATLKEEEEAANGPVNVPMGPNNPMYSHYLPRLKAAEKRRSEALQALKAYDAKIRGGSRIDYEPNRKKLSDSLNEAIRKHMYWKRFMGEA